MKNDSIKTLLSIIGGCIIAFTLAIILRFLFPLPIITGFGLILILFAFQIIEAKFGGGIKVAKDWAKAALRAVMGIIIFLALRFIAGQVLHLYPIDQHAEWGTSGGLSGIFWGHDASKTMTWEILFTFIAGGIAVGWSQGNARAQKLVGMVFGISFLLVTVQLALPNWSAKWPTIEKLDRTLSSEGMELTLDGTEDDRYKFVELYRQIRFIVPVGPGATEWVKKPEGATGYLVKSRGVLFAQFWCEDGRTNWVEINPMGDTKINFPGRVLGVRFKNSSGKEVLVDIQFTQ